MNDRFKFRAWNKLSNEMKDVISLNINYEFPDCSNVILETNTFDNIKSHNNPITCSNGLNNVILMQCTGLKDKNGKLIYEGDVVNGSCGVYWGKMIVEYNVAGFVLNKNGKYLNFLEGDNYIEVIGNIYQDSHLLEN